MKVSSPEFQNISQTDEWRIGDETVFIWIDILGFSALTEIMEEYHSLLESLKSFQALFSSTPFFKTRIISDGLIIFVDPPDNLSAIEMIFEDIGKKQLEFILNRKQFVRGGIGLGRRMEDEDENGDRKLNHFISNGLSRAVKMEGTFVNWPVIGLNNETLIKIRNHEQIQSEESDFGLLKGFNKEGHELFFIDFMREDIQLFNLLAINATDTGHNDSVRQKYRWLLRYFLWKYPDTTYIEKNHFVLLEDYVL